MIRSVPTERAAEEIGDESTRDPETHGDPDPARVLARHDELGERPGDQADDGRPDQVHWDSSSISSGPCRTLRLLSEVRPGPTLDLASAEQAAEALHQLLGSFVAAEELAGEAHQVRL